MEECFLCIDSVFYWHMFPAKISFINPLQIISVLCNLVALTPH